VSSWSLEGTYHAKHMWTCSIQTNKQTNKQNNKQTKIKD
jgi:hypothetical protein